MAMILLEICEAGQSCKATKAEVDGLRQLEH